MRGHANACRHYQLREAQCAPCRALAGDQAEPSREVATAPVSQDIGRLQDAHRWPGLAAVGKITSVRVTAGRTFTETRYYILSRKISPKEFLNAVRNQWVIELHWVLDVPMRKDDLRNWTGHSPVTIGTLRRFALSAMRLAIEA